jgi:hypothetical protein
MRALIFIAALSLGGVAVAQGAQQQQPAQQEPQPSGETVDDPSQATGPEGITQQGTDPDGQATAPAGTNQMPAMQADPGMAPAATGQQSTFTPRPAAGEYPPCTRTVTDNCIQTYERGVRRSRPRR